MTPIALDSALSSKHRGNGVSAKEVSPDLLSIIIPCFNESANIGLCLLFLQKHCHRPDLCEVILVDGNSSDQWIDSLQNGLLNPQNGQNPISMKVSISPFSEHQCSGRGVCQNIGVRKSSGNLLFFVHADTVLFDGFDEYIRSTLHSNDRIITGSFKFAVNRSFLNEPLVGLGTMELFARIRNDHYWLPYGDQTYFVKKHVFTALLKGTESESLSLHGNTQKVVDFEPNSILNSNSESFSDILIFRFFQFIFL